MGGYAAIKFSKLLGATEVISLCPQWSIDPAESLKNPWGSYFVPSMTGMSIRTEDVSGSVFLFVDNTDHVDSFHSGKICGAYPATNIINVPMVGHHITTVLAGTQNLLEIIDACRARRSFDLTMIGSHSESCDLSKGGVDHIFRRNAVGIKWGVFQLVPISVEVSGPQGLDLRGRLHSAREIEPLRWASASRSSYP
jgi:hypothetical protein